MIDFHTHILPFMDDGSENIDTSINMLKEIENDGVDVVCLTPHFYSSYESIDDFIKRRNESYINLRYTGRIKLILGAEVKYYPSMSEDREIGKLCLEGTNILLVELPLTSHIDDSVIYEIMRLKVRGFDVVLAHIERYNLKIQIIDYLYKSGIKFQMNTRTLTDFSTRKKALKMVQNRYISYLGSDAHDLKKRAPYFKKAVSKLQDLLGDELEYFINGLYSLAK